MGVLCSICEASGLLKRPHSTDAASVTNFFMFL